MARHPWELTLREFVDIVWRNYGIEVDHPSAAMAAGLFLSKGKRVIFPVAVLDEDEDMPIPLLRYFCRLYHVPPEDFGLAMEEKD